MFLNDEKDSIIRYLDMTVFRYDRVAINSEIAPKIMTILYRSRLWVNGHEIVHDNVDVITLFCYLMI